MTDQNQNAEDKHPDNYSPNPSDLDFYRDPKIYEQGDVTQATEETHAEHGTESGHGPRGNRRSDEDIREEIHKMMAFQQAINASDVQVHVKNGVVTLSGNVRSQYEKQALENVTGNVLGIHEIHNLLKIHEPGSQG